MGDKRKTGSLFGGLAIVSLVLVILFHSLSPGANTQHPHCEGELRTVNWVGKNLEGANCSRQIFREADLSEANLRRANLRGNDFSGAATRLIDTDLQGADLTWANLQGTNAVRANFSQAILQEADLSGANLNGTRFNGANLEGAKFIKAKLIAADLSDLKYPPAYLDGADLTDAKLGFDLRQVKRLCNATMPDGGISKNGCFTLSYELKADAANLKEFQFTGTGKTRNWRWLEQSTAYWLTEAFIPSEAVKRGDWLLGITPEQIKTLPCTALRELDQVWREASGDRFGLSIQRKIWESPKVNQDYNKFGEAVGWKQQGKWLKYDDLNFIETEGETQKLPIGYLPWHQWQVQGPTKEQPTRFRRVGFGPWMARLKACGI